MVAAAITTTLTIYSRVTKAAARVRQEIGSDNKGEEVLQLIAEDIDRMSVSGDETEISIDSKTQDGIFKSQMTMTSYIYDASNKQRVYEQVVWRSFFDEYDETLYLYRAHGGIALEDTMLDKIPNFRYTDDLTKTQEELQEMGKEMFVPICSGMSLFEFAIPSDDDEDEPRYSWSSKAMPNVITVNISFAEPIEDVFGDFIIPPGKIYTRTIATNRLRDIEFKFIRKAFDPPDPNDLSDGVDPNDLDAVLDAISDKLNDEEDSDDN